MSQVPCRGEVWGGDCRAAVSPRCWLLAATCGERICTALCPAEPGDLTQRGALARCQPASAQTSPVLRAH